MKKLPDEVFEGDINRVNLNTVPNLLCKEHDLQIDFNLREVRCRVCGYGFRFNIHEVKYKDKHLFDLSGKQLA